MDETVGGRLFFTNLRRGLVDEDEINLTSVGIDIGSSTSHLAFSRITLERADSRYIVAGRKLLFESDILLTPYAASNSIDTGKLDAFLQEQYRRSGIGFDAIDTGALILTGTALRRRNARAIADLFSAAAGKFVSVSAGDAMEAVLAAQGSGAAARSAASGQTVLNVDIGGGTTKIARCVGGRVESLTAIDIGARLLALDDDGRLARLEPAGARLARECGLALRPGDAVKEAELETIAERMADRLMEAMGARPLSTATAALLRLDALSPGTPGIVTFSGGVAEYIYGREPRSYGDLGPLLARKIADRVAAWGPTIEASIQGIRATVIGASQYTVQMSGSTIFVSDMSILPLRNLPIIKPDLPLEDDRPDAAAIAAAIHAALARLGGEHDTVALCYSWTQSAGFARLDAFCRGVAAGFAGQIGRGQPLVVIGDHDVGGLIGLHFAQEIKLQTPIISIDGVTLQEFDFVDIGALLEGSGSLPVVIKSLVFPAVETVRPLEKV